MVLEHTSHSLIRKQAIQEGMTGLFKNGMKKVEEGVTSHAEIQRITLGNE